MSARAVVIAGGVALIAANLPGWAEISPLVFPHHLAALGGGATPQAVRPARGMTPDRDTVSRAVDRHAARFGIPPAVFHRLVKRESGYNPRAVGPVTPYGRAYGPTQILCSTARGLGEADCGRLTRDPDRAVELAALYLKQGYAATGSWAGAAAYYHGGPNTGLHGRKTKAYAAAVAGAFSPVRMAFTIAPLVPAHVLEVRG